MPLVASKNLQSSDMDLLRLLDRYFDHPYQREITEATIWSIYGKNCAVMFTDMSGYSASTRKLGAVHALSLVYQKQKHLIRLLDAYGGHLMKTMGDSAIILFDTAECALECAIQIMRSDESRDLSIGIGFGKVIQMGKRDVFGVEVNHASFLAEDCGQPGQLLVTSSFMDELTRRPRYAPIPGSSWDKTWEAFEVSWI